MVRPCLLPQAFGREGPWRERVPIDSRGAHQGWAATAISRTLGRIRATHSRCREVREDIVNRFRDSQVGAVEP
jgi:hypothetical protein